MSGQKKGKSVNGFLLFRFKFKFKTLYFPNKIAFVVKTQRAVLQTVQVDPCSAKECGIY
jgi:hypothetical protein